jgi:hypothetical protein
MRYTLSTDAACAVVDDGAVILHMRTKRYYSLNETGVAIWSMLEASRSVDEIVESLTATYEIDAGSAKSEVDRMLVELASVDLLRRDVGRFAR